MNRKIFKSLLIVEVLLVSVSVLTLGLKQGYSKDASNLDKREMIEKKIEGTYKIVNIIKKNNIFRINFRQEGKATDTKIKKFFIDTKHVHYALQQGKTVDLEALMMDKKSWEASQVLVNLDTLEGQIPVWILSSKEDSVELEASKYLKMHVPSTDFRVF